MNRSVFVTGATNGTGYAIAKRFAEEGYDVFITSRRKADAEEAAARLAAETGRNCYGYGLEAFNEQQVKEAFADIRQKGYLLDTLVCNAANLGIGQDTLSIEMDDFMNVINTNIGWNFMMAREAALQMKEKGSGAIVFINSNTAYRAIPSRAAYSCSKGGILSLSRALAVDLGPYGIRVNGIAPGLIITKIADRYKPEHLEGFLNKIPVGFLGQTEHIVPAIMFLADENSSRYIVGQILRVDGGQSVSGIIDCMKEDF